LLSAAASVKSLAVLDRTKAGRDGEPLYQDASPRWRKD